MVKRIVIKGKLNKGTRWLLVGIVTDLTGTIFVCYLPKNKQLPSQLEGLEANDTTEILQTV